MFIHRQPTAILLALLLLLSFSASPPVSSQITFDESVHYVQESGSNCFLALAIKHFDLHSTLAMVKSRSQYVTSYSLGISTEDLILQKLINTGSWSMVTKFIGTGAKPKVDYGFEKVHNYVVMFQNVPDLRTALKELSSVNSWNPHAKFMGYFAGFPEDLDLVMAEVVELFWSLWVVEVTFIVPVKEITGHIVSLFNY